MDTPLWVKKALGRSVWQEDDARPPDAETLQEAWSRIFGEPYPAHETVLARHDGGDADYFLFPGGKVVCESYPGNDAIYQLKEDDTSIGAEAS